jgi:transposase InsO family protein
MGISTSTYYYKPRKSRTLRDFADAELRENIEAIQLQHPYAGYRMVRNYLYRRHGKWVNGKRIRRVMGQYGLQARVRRRFIHTTDSKHTYPVYPNLIRGKTVTDINQVWVSDITYIRIATGFVLLAVILDVFSRRVVGWALGKSISHQLTLGALKMALALRKPGPGLIHHSDRAGQYACEQYIHLLTHNGIQISMSASGNPYHNAYAESFIKTLKKEEVHLWQYEHFVDVVERIPYFIEDVYNKKRLHSGIHYLPPEEFEDILNDKDAHNKLGQITLTIR